MPCYPFAVWLRSQGFLCGAVQRQEVQELPVLRGTWLARGHIRLPLHSRLQGWWNHSCVLGNSDAHGGVGLRWGHEKDHKNSSLPWIRVRVCLSFLGFFSGVFCCFPREAIASYSGIHWIVIGEDTCLCPGCLCSCQTVEGLGVVGCWHLYLAGFAPRVSSDSLLQECLLLPLLSFGRHVLCSVPLSSVEAPDR